MREYDLGINSNKPGYIKTILDLGNSTLDKYLLIIMSLGVSNERCIVLLGALFVYLFLVWVPQSATLKSYS